MAAPTTEQLGKINRLALVPMTEEQVHVFQARVIGTKRIEKYKMKITPNFLRKMADQVREGVALLVDHPWMKWEAVSFPYGRTFDSRIVEEGGELELYGDHYMVKGQEADGISTDKLALGIDSGTIFDTSAGFVTKKHICGICSGNYFGNPDCSHVRGNFYDGKECIILADDGYIMENSIVFDGGYEGAGFTRGSLSITKKVEREVENEYEPLSLDTKSLPSDGSVFYFFSNKNGMSAFVQKQQTNEEVKALTKGDESMSDAQKQVELDLQQAQSALNVSNGLLAQITAALGATSNEGILAKITALSAQAKDGETYKTKITEEACGAGVRAMGEAFNVEVMKLSLSNLPVAEIEKISASYEAQAKVVLGGGGRHTQGEEVKLPAGALSGVAPGNPNAEGLEKTPEQLRAAAKEEARASLARTGHGDLLKGDK
ncbi:hypothetical protein [Paenibacillus radicis (ex Xue et al. 2023)]|uniref:DUF2213 domain-containing protein n=1 Tax=Paenibacillus radicis (ex Xue et al. 2023) TaxID=2972489 RepID=A0ABT1YJX8_9BACL|nr:hypothetical protein [Paenibacillus radicis (ex Xue et al. 2023)]MCR8633484.1 hypothetical protein [Paenibacillus radicis (ex Xue et al. 2023)]